MICIVNDLVRDDQPWMKDERCMRSIFNLREKPAAPKKRPTTAKPVSYTTSPEKASECQRLTRLKQRKIKSKQRKSTVGGGIREERQLIEQLKKDLSNALLMVSLKF